LLAIVILFDIGSYQYAVLEQIPVFYHYPNNIYVTHPMKFNAERVTEEKYPSAMQYVINMANNMRQTSGYFELYADMFYPFFDFDPCYPMFRGNILMKNIYQAIIINGGSPRETGPNFLGSMNKSLRKDFACHANKLKLSTSFNTKDSVINVSKFNANAIHLLIKNHSGAYALLYYADAFHPHWRAYIDSVPTDIFQTPLGFKSVYVPTGVHNIVFRYGTLIDWFAGYFTIFIGILFTVIMLYLYGLLLINDCIHQSSIDV
jgi:hypothetical protein